MYTSKPSKVTTEPPSSSAEPATPIAATTALAWSDLGGDRRGCAGRGATGIVCTVVNLLVI
jgi:hypothetical protein